MMNNIESRLVAAVSAKLGASVSFVRWIKSQYGDVPVFQVPSELRERAQELGLTVI